MGCNCSKPIDQIVVVHSSDSKINATSPPSTKGKAGRHVVESIKSEHRELLLPDPPSNDGVASKYQNCAECLYVGKMRQNHNGGDGFTVGVNDDYEFDDDIDAAFDEHQHDVKPSSSLYGMLVKSKKGNKNKVPKTFSLQRKNKYVYNKLDCVYSSAYDSEDNDDYNELKQEKFSIIDCINSELTYQTDSIKTECTAEMSKTTASSSVSVASPLSNDDGGSSRRSTTVCGDDNDDATPLLEAITPKEGATLSDAGMAQRVTSLEAAVYPSVQQIIGYPTSAMYHRSVQRSICYPVEGSRLQHGITTSDIVREPQAMYHSVKLLIGYPVAMSDETGLKNKITKTKNTSTTKSRCALDQVEESWSRQVEELLIGCPLATTSANNAKPPLSEQNDIAPNNTTKDNLEVSSFESFEEPIIILQKAMTKDISTKCSETDDDESDTSIQQDDHLEDSTISSCSLILDYSPCNDDSSLLVGGDEFKRSLTSKQLTYYNNPNNIFSIYEVTNMDEAHKMMEEWESKKAFRNVAKVLTKEEANEDETLEG